MPNTTTRLALVEPVGTDAPSELRLATAANAVTLDNSVLVTEGTLAARPAANSVEHNHVYHATDTAQWFQSDGTNWGTVLVAGQWTALTLATGIGTTVGAGSTTPSVRLEGDVVRFKGALANNTGGPSSGVWATLPTFAKPTFSVFESVPEYLSFSMNFVSIAYNSTQMNIVLSVPDTSHYITLDGLTYTLT